MMTKKERGDGVKNPIEQPFCFPFSRQDFCKKVKLQKFRLAKELHEDKRIFFLTCCYQFVITKATNTSFIIAPAHS